MENPFDIRENKLLLPALIVLLAAMVFAGSLLMYGKGNAGPAEALPYQKPSVPKGQKNPADGLPRVEGQRVAGFVLSVDSNGIIISPKPPQSANAPLSIQSERYGIDASTVIYAKGKLKSQSQIQRELEDFNTAIAYADPTANVIYKAPDPFEHVTLSLAELKEGTAVLVMLKDDNETAHAIFVQNR